jgi:hypothetical protein
VGGGGSGQRRGCRQPGWWWRPAALRVRVFGVQGGGPPFFGRLENGGGGVTALVRKSPKS